MFDAIGVAWVVVIVLSIGNVLGMFISWLERKKHKQAILVLEENARRVNEVVESIKGQKKTAIELADTAVRAYRDKGGEQEKYNFNMLLDKYKKERGEMFKLMEIK